MTATDPLRDLEQRIDRLASRMDLADQTTASEVAAIKDDIAQIRATHSRFVTVESNEWVVWAVRLLIGGLVLATFGGIVAIALGK